MSWSHTQTLNFHLEVKEPTTWQETVEKKKS